MGRLKRLLNIADLRRVAKRRLPKGLFEYIDRGADDDIAIVNNRSSFERIKLRNRVLVDLSNVTLDTTLFGKPSGMPLAISPTGLAGLCWHEGELALAKAAATAKIPYTLAIGSITPMEKIAREAGGRLWMQLYMWSNRELSYNIVRRAGDAGFEALILTVDQALGSNREHNKRNDFTLPFRLSPINVADLMLHPGWVGRVILRYLLKTGIPRHENYPPEYQKHLMAKKDKTKSLRGESLTWDDVDKLRKIWPGTLMLKGILRADDALRAVERGVDGVIISNHGGRYLDSAQATIDALPEIVDAVGNKTTVILDSGIRRGSDIVKGVALGAKAVMMGRATLYGVAAAGQAGAEHALSLLRNEFRLTMGQTGCQCVEDIKSDILAPVPRWAQN